MMMNHFSIHSIALILGSLFMSSLVIWPSAAVNIMSLPSMPTNTTVHALLSFKSLLVDPLGSLASWDNNGSLHYCGWRGVICDRRHPFNVVALDLGSLRLSGIISPVISNLTFLKKLDLSDNQLHGKIPEQIGRLSRLRALNLSWNHLEGEIPTTLSHCSYIQNISLRSNKLSGEIPSNLTRCFDLRFLIFTDNKLSGEIPTGIGSLPMLESLFLGGNNFNGRIPPLLGSSNSLRWVGIWNNSLMIGGIPPFLANCSTLKGLYLEGNSLTGGTPPSLGNSTSLIDLDLSRNQLTGDIPPFITDVNHLSPLNYLALSANHLTGHIPPSLGNLSALQVLSLNTNDLEGGIPQSLGNIPGLQHLTIFSNRLSGTIPPSLFNSSTIRILQLGNNQLSGALPLDLGLNLPQISALLLYQNQLEGPIPASVSNATTLIELSLANNSFGGTIPSNMGFLTNLSKLDLSLNQLATTDWSFLSSLSNCTLLKALALSFNNIGGVLPSSVGKLSSRLEILDLAHNAISGIIPSEIENLVSLVRLGLSENLFSGGIPASIGELRKLGKLFLCKNKLSGPIPSSIGNLDQLIQLDIRGNTLSGDIPASFGGCTSLEYLDLSHNVLIGTIPRELLSLSSLNQGLDISNNALTGSIPMEVGKLVNLGYFDVSNNHLSGDIPPTFGACQHLEQLYMGGNFFQGNIPQSFVNLRGLQALDLSRNNLTGRIPYFLESFGSLRSLNLSFNDFEGEVPNSGGVFDNASGISVLGNNKLCGGLPALRLPICTIHASERGSIPLKIIIPTVSASIILLLSLIGILYMKKNKKGVKDPSPASLFKGAIYRKITYADIHKATDGLSPINLLGAGSFGSVYKGKINFEERFVAVKVLKLHQKGASRSFTTECEALRSIRHRNLVKIITACSSIDYRGNDFKALVFEYIPNGSLQKWLYAEVILDHPDQPQKLTLFQRLNIAVDVASALDYLHHSCQPPVVHCDLKPSNILIDNDMIAHVGDFGLAKLLTKSISVASNVSTSSMGIKGTIGYVAPEYGMGSQVSTQGDAYSFGILLLEMLTGRKPTDDMFKDGLNLRRFVEIAFPLDLKKVLDPWLVSQDEVSESRGDNISNEISICRERNKECIISLVRIGLFCSTDVPIERMTTRDALTEIHKIKEQFLIAEA